MPSQVIRPSKWASGYFKQMPLVELTPGAYVEHYSAMLHMPYVATPDELAEATRIACLSQKGVNLLLQRWVHHNSRAIVSTDVYQQVSSPQFEEADIIEDWCSEREDDGVDSKAATAEIDAWLSDATQTGVSPRESLKEPQYRSPVRQAIRRHLRSLRKNSK
jgi:hypothetical protein